MKSVMNQVCKVMAGALLALICSPELASGSTVSAGVKAEIKGRINKRGMDTIVVRDANDMDTVVLLTDSTVIKSNKKGLGVFRRGKDYEATSLLRGLMVSVEGTGNTEGQLVAKEVRFSDADLKDVMTVQSRVQPVEEEQKKLSGKLDETSAEAKKANESADAAHQRLDSVNDRITGLDDFVVQDTVAVYFPVNKYTLAPDDKKSLDGLAAKAQASKGYVIEVAGFADSTGDPDKNLELSQRRADAVVQYLAISHNIPPRRIVTPIGYGDTKSGGDTTSQERRLDRRVDAKLMVSRGQQAQ
jgi:outer membrane protein OmpA-like peptidoglycan-associated protein